MHRKQQHFELGIGPRLRRTRFLGFVQQRIVNNKTEVSTSGGRITFKICPSTSLAPAVAERDYPKSLPGTITIGEEAHQQRDIVNW